MRNLVEIFNDGDLRWLLITDVLPEDYDVNYLVPVLDTIIYEYERLKGDNFYSNYLRKADINNKDIVRLVVLRGCFTLLSVGCIEQAKEILSEINISLNGELKEMINSVDFKMKETTQKLQVKAIKDSKKPVEKANFGQLCAQISANIDGVSIKDVREATVAEFLGYEKIIKEQNG